MPCGRLATHDCCQTFLAFTRTNGELELWPFGGEFRELERAPRLNPTRKMRWRLPQEREAGDWEVKDQ